MARSFPPEYWLEKDTRAEYPFEFVKAFAQAGWLGVIVPEEYGGSGLGVTEAALMLHDWKDRSLWFQLGPDTQR